LYQPDKSAVAVHSIEWGYQIKFENTEVLAKIVDYVDRLVNAAIEIRLHPSNINKEEGFKLGQAWSPAIKILQTNDTGYTNN
jgi:hypothetical protein